MDLDLMEEEMLERIEYLKEEFGNIRAGRANPQILNKVKVDYYGASTPLNQVASISVPEPRQILIMPWDRNLVPEINKAILKADIGINPIQDATSVRLVFPELTGERRKELVKDIQKIAENVKVSIRNIRRDAIDNLKKHSKEDGLSEDDVHKSEDEIQKITDKYILEVTKNAETKENEIMEV